MHEQQDKQIKHPTLHWALNKIQSRYYTFPIAVLQVPLIILFIIQVHLAILKLYMLVIFCECPHVVFNLGCSGPSKDIVQSLACLLLCSC